MSVEFVMSSYVMSQSCDRSENCEHEIIWTLIESIAVPNSLGSKPVFGQLATLIRYLKLSHGPSSRMCDLGDFHD